MQLCFEAVAETRPGAKWQALFRRHWPAYRRWFLARGGADRPALPVAIKRLRRYMPELLPVFEQLVELADGDETAARFLSGYRPPAYLSGCSQAVWTRDGEPLLIRNYDLDPGLNEGLILHSAWSGRRVVVSSEFLWGAADGMNEAGLAVSLAFGGRRVLGDGFGITLILRYILEVCDRVSDALEVLRTVPSHMAYNITLLDASGEFATVRVAPDRPTEISREPLATNHQGAVEWHEHARFTHSLERERYLRGYLARTDACAQSLLNAFLRAPLYRTEYRKGFGTLYTAVYRPRQQLAEWRWPEMIWRQSLTGFREGRRLVRYSDAGARAVSKPLRAWPVVPEFGDDWEDWAGKGDFSLESVLRQTWRTVHGALGRSDRK